MDDWWVPLSKLHTTCDPNPDIQIQLKIQESQLEFMQGLGALDFEPAQQVATRIQHRAWGIGFRGLGV